MAPLISYVIPAHNGEKYLTACINSILAQPDHDFEILIAENGSTDKTAAMCRALCLENERIRFLQTPTGVSRARNEGLCQAHGEWVCFVDQDDLLLPNAFSVFEEGIQKYPKSDLLCARGDGYGCAQSSWRYYAGEETTALTANFLVRPTRTLAAWGKLYRRAFLYRNKLLFDSELTHAEDSDFVLRALLAADGVGVTGTAVYHYTVNPDSAVHRKNGDLAQKYLPSLQATRQHFQSAPAVLRRVFPLYVLDHLLIILVHDTCLRDRAPVLQQLRETRKLLREPVFAQALKEAPLREAGAVKALLFGAARCGFVLPLFLAARLRGRRSRASV